MSMRTFVTCLRRLPLLALPVLAALAATPAAGPTRLLRMPAVSATQIAFVYANNIWVVERAGGLARRLTSFQGQTSNPHFSPDGKWIAFSGDYAGNTDVYVVPAAGRRTEASDLAPRRRPGPGLDSRRQGGPLRLLACHLGAERRAALLDGARRRGRRGADGAAPRLSGQDLPRRHAHRLSDEQLVGRGAPQLPRRTEPPHLDRRSQDLRPGVAALDRFEGRRSRVGGRFGLLHLRPRRRGERLDVRHEGEEAGAGHQVHRFRRQDAQRRRRRRGIRAGRLHPRAGPEIGQRARREHHGGRRLPVDDAEVGRRDQPHDECRDLTHGKARRGRSPRRDLHRACREGGRPEPQQLERLGRARSGLVAGRQIRFVFQRQIGGVQAGDRIAGRADAATRNRAAEPDPLLHAVLVAGLQEDRVHRHEPEGVGAGRGVRAGQDCGQRSLDGAAAHAQSRVEPGLEVGRVLEPAAVAVSCDLREQRGDRRNQAGHRRARGCGMARLGRERQIRLVSRVHGFRAGVAVARHDFLRPQRELRAVLCGPEKRRAEPAAPRER